MGRSLNKSGHQLLLMLLIVIFSITAGWYVAGVEQFTVAQAIAVVIGGVAAAAGVSLYFSFTEEDSD